MQAIATWLVARPQNAVLGLAVTLLLPAPQLTSGVIMVLLVLSQGITLAIYEATIAAGVLVVTALILSISLTSLMVLVVGTWIPVMLLAGMLTTTRSLTLTLQVSVIVAVMAMLGFQLVVADPAAFWEPYLTAMTEMIRENGLEFNAEILSADVMTISVVLGFWLLYNIGLLFGYRLYRLLPFDTEDFGRFRELNFGRVIAFTLALASLLAFVIDASWLQNVAFIMFVIFMLQGLAIVHWLCGEKILPVAVLVAVYVLLPFLQVLLVMSLAIVGYTDAWFSYRRRFRKA